MNNLNTHFSDKDILIDVLTSIKSLASLYHNFSIEASNDLVFDISSDLREEIFDEQRDCYNLLYSKGWYQIEKQPQIKLSKDIESDKLTKDLDVKEKVDMKKLSDIRIGSKIVTIPQHNAAPKKVECKTVIVTLDGKDYESVCMPEDEFNLERGIEVCILKSIFGGTQKYNKYIRKTVSFYNDCEKKRAEEDRIKAKREKEIARQKARKERVVAKARKARVDEMSEAFFNAMKSYDNSITDKERNDRIAMDIDKIVDVFASKGLINMPNNTDNTTTKYDSK